MLDSSAWSLYSGALPTFTSVTDGKVGNGVARSSAAGIENWFNEVRKIPVDPTKTYRVRAWMRTVSGAGSTVYMGTALFGSTGANISGDGSQWYYAAAESLQQQVGQNILEASAMGLQKLYRLMLVPCLL